MTVFALPVLTGGAKKLAGTASADTRFSLPNLRVYASPRLTRRTFARTRSLDPKKSPARARSAAPVMGDGSVSGARADPRRVVGGGRRRLQSGISRRASLRPALSRLELRTHARSARWPPAQLVERRERPLGREGSHPPTPKRAIVFQTGRPFTFLRRGRASLRCSPLLSERLRSSGPVVVAILSSLRLPTAPPPIARARYPKTD